jgi:hypothetical protein
LIITGGGHHTVSGGGRVLALRVAVGELARVVGPVGVGQEHTAA